MLDPVRRLPRAPESVLMCLLDPGIHLAIGGIDAKHSGGPIVLLKTMIFAVHHAVPVTQLPVV